MNHHSMGDTKTKRNSPLAPVNLAGVHSLKSHDKVHDNKVALGVCDQSQITTMMMITTHRRSDHADECLAASLAPLSASCLDIISIRRLWQPLFLPFPLFLHHFVFLRPGIQTAATVCHQVPLWSTGSNYSQQRLL